MMDKIKSFKGYGKVDEAQQAAFKKTLRKRIILISVSATFLIIVLITAITVTTTHHKSKSPSASSTSVSTSLKAVCSVTLYPNSCFASMSPLTSNNNTTSYSDDDYRKKIFSLSLRVAKDEVVKFRKEFTMKNTNGVVEKAVRVCRELFDDVEDRLDECISYKTFDDKMVIDDLRTWLSAALTDQETCLDTLSEINVTDSLVNDIRTQMRNSTELVSNSLAIVTKVISILGKEKTPFNKRKLLGTPEWVESTDRRFIHESNVMMADKVVAKDGSGDYKTIGEAIKAVLLKNEKRFVIYVKEGVYVEKVFLSKDVWNVMIIGDGMYKSIVSGSLNFIDGTRTFATATFAVEGRGFIAKDMGFKNTAGPAKHQAVALRSQSDRSIFYRCLFDGYQDTLYAHTCRQFYRDCTILGTIGFIFGDATAVFQNCNIQPRQPLPNQFNTITAQGKNEPNPNTGISIQKCTISGLGQVTAPTYLGRPWKNFSTTLIMQSNIGPVVHQMGWIEWNKGEDPPSTIYYAEYQNTGPGADVSNRVKWAGYKPTITANEASRFTVDNFIDGAWLAENNIAFQTSL